MVEEGCGTGHGAAEDGGGEFACGPEGRGLEVESFVWASGVEGDDEAHDGGDAGAVGTRMCISQAGFLDVCVHVFAEVISAWSYGLGEKRR